MDPVLLPIHPHPLRCRSDRFLCYGCHDLKCEETDHYFCDSCGTTLHGDCEEASTEFNHPFHPHPLKLVVRLQPDYSYQLVCCLCGRALQQLFYYCFVCDFSVDVSCVREPLPVTIDHAKCHKHTLTVLPRRISFACNVCGSFGHWFPYICLQCNFAVHRSCIFAPHVIENMRHNHRLSFTYHLPPGEWSCGICRQEINCNYGAYSCSKDCSYAVHLGCALRSDVWDGKEHEGEPDKMDETEDVEPFEKIDDRVIHHFSHEHHLKHKEDSSVYDESRSC